MDAIKNQLDTLTHTCFQVTPYESYVELAERLNDIYPIDFKEIYVFSAEGEAVENAVKVARYYTKRPAIITLPMDIMDAHIEDGIECEDDTI